MLQPADRGAGRRLGREERRRRLQVLALRGKGDNVILWIPSVSFTLRLSVYSSSSEGEAVSSCVSRSKKSRVQLSRSGSPRRKMTENRANTPLLSPWSKRALDIAVWTLVGAAGVITSTPQRAATAARHRTCVGWMTWTSNLSIGPSLSL